MTDLMQWYDYKPHGRGGNYQQGERQLMVSHSCKDRKQNYWRVVLGKQITKEVQNFAGDQFNIRFGKNKYTGEYFLAVFKGSPLVNYSQKELDRSGRICFTCKAMYEAFCEMMDIDKHQPARLYYELSENLSKTKDVITYRINLPF